MEFKIETSKFADRLSLMQGIAERRTTMPVLSHVLMEAKDEGLKLSATDLETSIRAECTAEVAKVGAISVPARKLYEIVRELPEGEAEVKEIGNHWIEIRSKSVQFRLAGLPHEDFPTIAEPEGEELFSVPSSLFEDMVNKTIFAVSPDDMRRNLAGIYFERPQEHTLRLVATDGHRLSLVEKHTEDRVRVGHGVVIPKKGVLELRKLFKLSDVFHTGCGRSEFIAKGEGITMLIRLIDAEFPDYKQVIPQETKKIVKVNRQNFLRALRRVSLLSADKIKSVNISVEKGNMTLASVSPELGEAKEEVGVDFSGEHVEIGVNATYVMDVLDVIDGDEVEFGINDELSPAVLMGSGDRSYISIIMPMRI